MKVRGFVFLTIAAVIVILTYTMRSTRSVKVRRLAVFFIYFLTIVPGIWVVLFLLSPILIRPVTDVKSAVAPANQVIASAGGPTEIRNEASRFFKRFKVSDGERRDLAYGELGDCPAIVALGKASAFWWPVIDSGGGDFPPYIEIRFGNHLNGYTIYIADTNSPVKFPTSTGTIELADACIFVSR